MAVVERFLAVRKLHPYTINLVKFGGFYESLDDDAYVVHHICGIALRTFLSLDGSREHVLAGIPLYLLEKNLQKLRQAEQEVYVEESATARRGKKHVKVGV